MVHQAWLLVIRGKKIEFLSRCLRLGVCEYDRKCHVLFLDLIFFFLTSQTPKYLQSVCDDE